MPRGHGKWVRKKVPCDLLDAATRETIRRSQVEYYGRRAAWFDDIYDCVGDYDHGPDRSAQWRADIAEIEKALADAPLRGDCVELGIGTGYWTERYVDRVDRVVGFDASVEMLDRAQLRLERHADKVALVAADLWEWRPQETWDCAVAFFFFEHVPDEILPGLLRALHRALRPDGVLFIAEEAARGPEGQVETRDIHDDRYFVVDRPRTADEFRNAFGSAGFEVHVGGSARFVHVIARRR